MEFDNGTNDFQIQSNQLNEAPLKKRIRSGANARERDRTQSVNSAFDVLRAMIPIDPPNRKLSKIETLQLATKYISHLSQILTSEGIMRLSSTEVLYNCGFVLLNNYY